MSIITTLSGLKFFQRNTGLYSAIRVANRTRRLPNKIVYYSRFASQLKFLRAKDQVIFKRTLNGDSNKLADHLSDQELDSITDLSRESHSSSTANSMIDVEAEYGDEQAQDNVHFKSPFKNDSEFTENDYIYKHVHKRLDYLANIGEEINTLPINSIIIDLKDILENKDLDEQTKTAQIDENLNRIRNRIKSMNQQELAILLSAIKSYEHKEFHKVKRMIDIELRWLLKKHVNTRLMDLDLWFYLADVFYEISMKSTFVHVLVNYLANERDVQITNRQFLHLLFLVILQRQQSGILAKYEERTLQMLNKTSFEDIALICMAYFKTRTKMENPEMLRRIIDRTIEHLSEIKPEESGYCAIIKCLRYSRNLEVRPNVKRLILSGDLDNRVITQNGYNAVHTAKLMETYRLYDPKMLDNLASSVLSNLDEFRIKDIQYSLTSLSNFAYRNLKLDKSIRSKLDSLCDQIVTEKRVDSNFQDAHLMPFLRAFSIFKYYNDDLISYANKALKNPDKVLKIKLSLEYDKSALLAYVATRLEGGKVALSSDGRFFQDLSASINRFGNMGSVRQDSSIKHLDFILRGRMIKNYVNSSLFRTLSQKLASHEEFQDPEYKFNFQYTFPHQNFGDLVISKGCSYPGQFDSHTLMPKRVPADETHCLLLVTRKEDYLDGYKRLCGYKQLIDRLLTNLGYIVINANLDDHNITALAKEIKSSLDKRN